jgi:parallel beta-helix repeat protein
MSRIKKAKNVRIVGIFLVIVLSSLAPLTAQTSTRTARGLSIEGTVLFVGGSGPGNYTRIQDAINDSHDGDTVYVYAASSPYHEHLEIANSIMLLGENETTTEINGSTLDTSLDTVNITGNHVTVSGFHITLNRGYYYQAALKVTGSYVTISDCNISRNGWIGIYLEGATHCQIQDCDLTDNLVAIYLVSSRSNTIMNCSCHDNSDAITLYTSSNDNQLINCTCMNNGFDNIHIQQSSGNHLIGCVCESGYDGISLAYTPGTLMRNNTMANNYANFGIGSPEVTDFYCDIDTSNTINGKPLYYLRGQQDLSLNGTDDIGFLGLVSCSNISVKNLSLSNNFEGLLLVDTTTSLIEHCRFQNNDGHGMYLIASSNNTVRSCVFENSFFDGVFLYEANRNILENCSSMGCVNGASFESSQENLLRGFVVSQCTVGISLSASSGNILRENNMDHCGLKIAGRGFSDFINDADTGNMVNDRPLYYYINENNKTIPSDAGQVILINCTGCNASGLNLSDASVGIELAYTLGNIITHNTLNNNRVVAVYLDGSNQGTSITENTITGNNYGIDVVSSTGILLQGNRLAQNGLGVAFGSSDGNIMIGNTITDGAYGVYFDGSSFNTMTDNTIDNASIFGVYLLFSESNVLKTTSMLNCSLLVYGSSISEYLHDVDMSNTVQGKPVYYYLHRKDTTVPQDAGEVILVDCSGCTIRNLALMKGTTGILLAYSSNNSLIGNTIVQQSVTGIDLSSGSNNDNTIQGNILEANSYGIDIEYSSRTMMKRNRILSNYYGILIYQAQGTSVRRNTISKNYYGIDVSQTSGSTVGFNNIFTNYIVGLNADACSVMARWNWWGALTGPQKKGEKLSVVNHGCITYTPWKLFPVLFAGVIPMGLTNEQRQQGTHYRITVLPDAHCELGQADCNEHHGLWDGKVMGAGHPFVFRNKVLEMPSLLIQLVPEVSNTKH